MNKKLIKFDEFYGASIDNNGDINIINKYNNFYTFEDILKRENELEILDYRINIANDDYLRAKNNIKNKRFSIIISSVFSFIVCFLFLENPLLALETFAMFEVMSLIICHYIYRSTKANKSIMTESNYKMAQLEVKKEELEKELSKIKEQVKYNVMDDTLEDEIVDQEPDLPYDIVRYPLEEEKPLKRVRVLDLTKK